MMERHYVCTGGCKGVSSVPGNCQDEDCDRYHEKMLACSCTDNKHRLIFEAGNDKKFNPDDAEIL